MSVKSKLSAAVLALIAAGATAPQIAKQFLKEKEGVSLTAYPDAGGVWTICYGETRGVKKGDKKTMEECEAMLDERLQEIEEESYAIAPGVQMSAPQRAAVMSFCIYNIGVTKCNSSTFLKLLKSSQREDACKQILRWVRDGGKDCRVDRSCFGQVTRRDQEYELCMTN